MSRPKKAESNFVRKSEEKSAKYRAEFVPFPNYPKDFEFGSGDQTAIGVIPAFGGFYVITEIAKTGEIFKVSEVNSSDIENWR